MKNLVYFFLLISFFSFSQEEKRLALVIGNANYDKGELKNPVNDARLIASTLDSLDFDVILKENIENRSEFIRAIREFGTKRPDYDVAFVYYAGHGIQVDDENFLLPTKEEFSSEEDVLDFAVSVQNVMRYLKSQTDEVNILILDACRDNPFESSWNTTRSLKGEGLAKIPPPTGSLIAFSTDSGQTAPDGDGENSIYSISLAKNMLLEDTSIDQVFRNVRSEVLNQTNQMQRPVEATQLTGKGFYLKPRTSEKLIIDFDIALVKKDYENALNLSFELINNFPNLSDTYVKAGHIRTIKKEYFKATEYYKKSLEIDRANYESIQSNLFHSNNSSDIDLGLINSLSKLYDESFYSVEDYANELMKLLSYVNIDGAGVNERYLMGEMLRSTKMLDETRINTTIIILKDVVEKTEEDNSFEEFYKSISIYDKTVPETFSVKAILYNQLSAMIDEYVDYKKDKGLEFSNEEKESLIYIDKAIFYENELNSESPNLSYLYNLKSYILRKQSRFIEAKKFILKAIGKTKIRSNANNYSFLSKIYFNLEDKENSIKYANLSIEEKIKNKAPNTSMINSYFSVGMLHYSYGDYLRAFGYIEAAWNLDNKYVVRSKTYQFLRAITLVKLGDKSIICDSDFITLINNLNFEKDLPFSTFPIYFYSNQKFWIDQVVLLENTQSLCE